MVTKQNGGLYGSVKIPVKLLDIIIVIGLIALATVMIFAAK